MSEQFNSNVLMSGADYFDDSQEINPFMHKNVKIDRQKAQAEHQSIQTALKEAGVNVKVVPPPKDCQDGVYTANWGLVRGDKVVLSTLPNARKGEEPYAEKVLKDLGKTTYKVPDEMRFSGQGDALPCGEFLFAGSNYRTNSNVWPYLEQTLGYKVIGLQTIPKRTWYGKRVINKDTGWPDSYFYDLDLALAVLRQPTQSQKGLIAWCPDAFWKDSRKRLAAFNDVDKIEISMSEAKKGFACNLVSTGETVIMSSHAPKFRAKLESMGFKVVTIEAAELKKGGGYIRCTTLTLDNV